MISKKYIRLVLLVTILCSLIAFNVEMTHLDCFFSEIKTVTSQTLVRTESSHIFLNSEPSYCYLPTSLLVNTEFADNQAGNNKDLHERAQNRAPFVTVTSPNGGENLSGSTTINWTVIDPDMDEFTIDVSYSANGGANWTSLATGLTNTSLVWDLRGLADGSQYRIKVEAHDYELTGVDMSNTVFIIDQNGPTITNVYHDPSEPWRGGIVSVFADVIDISGLFHVTCYFRVNMGTWEAFKMTLDAGNTYNVSSDPFGGNDTVEYYVLAHDNSPSHFGTVTPIKKFVVYLPVPWFDELGLVFALIALLAGFQLYRRRRKYKIN
ncbi:MAG: hypothetical protein ACFFC7_18300 [Candidatus Hermodarchaeota archaeon]